MSEYIIEKDIVDITDYNFTEYALETIIRRSLPDVRDGLKPVHRRVLYSMFELGLAVDFAKNIEKAYKKCARIVGDTMGKYHPHGDSSIYGALVTLTQDFKNSVPLIDGYGNFGSWDDGPAAMRYTEARLSNYGTSLLYGIDKNGVSFQNNFDDSEKEPVTLPSLLPNLLINGASGIAVGYSCDIPTHNVNEVCDAFIYRIENPKCGLKEILGILKGPDFPGYGIIDPSGLQECYETGKGKIKVRGLIEIEPLPKNCVALVINSIPYEVKGETLQEKIVSVLSDPIYKFETIENLSEKNKVIIRIIFGENPPLEKIIDLLYMKTNLEINYSYNFVTVVNNRPKTLSLIDYFDILIEDKTMVLKNIFLFDLEKEKRELLIVEAKLLVISNTDETIAIIKDSKTKQLAIDNICNRFNVIKDIAQIIVDTRLYTLTKQETDLLLKNKKEIESRIKNLNTILKSKTNIQKELVSIINKDKSTFQSQRKTKIQSFEKMNIKEVSTGDFILQANKECYNVLQSNSKSKTGILLKTKQSATIYSFLENGDFIKFHGNSIRDKEPHNIISLYNETDLDDKFIIHITSDGQIQKTNINSWKNSKENKLLKAMKIPSNSKIIGVFVSDIDFDIVLETKNKMCICFNTNEVRATSSETTGMKAISLIEDDMVVNSYILDKKIKLQKQKRGGKGFKIK